MEGGGGGERERERGGGGGGTPDNHNKHGTNKRSETEPMMGSECFVEGRPCGRMSNVKYTYIIYPKSCLSFDSDFKFIIKI